MTESTRPARTFAAGWCTPDTKPGLEATTQAICGPPLQDVAQHLRRSETVAVQHQRGCRGNPVAGRFQVTVDIAEQGFVRGSVDPGAFRLAVSPEVIRAYGVPRAVKTSTNVGYRPECSPRPCTSAITAFGARPAATSARKPQDRRMSSTNAPGASCGTSQDGSYTACELIRRVGFRQNAIPSSRMP